MKLEFSPYQPLRFYEDLNHQNRFKSNCHIGVFKLLCPTDFVLPFQIRRESSVLPINSVRYVNLETLVETELIGDFVPDQLTIFTFNDYDVVTHFGSQPLNVTMDEGDYYLIVSDGVNTWYSEVVSLTDFDSVDLSSNSCTMTKITYWNNCDISDIFYRTESLGYEQYKNVLYFNIEIGSPQYEFTEEGEEDSEGNFVADYKKLEKKYVIQDLYPEFIVDAVQLFPLHEFVEVQSHQDYVGFINTVTVSSEWQGTSKCWSLTDIIFSTEYIIKVGCCDADDVPVEACINVENQFLTEILENGTEYNNFQYNDLSLEPGNIVSTPIWSNESSSFTSWGSGIGVLPPFRSLRFKVRDWDPGNPIANVRIRIRNTTYDGPVLADFTGPFATDASDWMEVDFETTINNGTNPIWFEFLCDGRSGIFGEEINNFVAEQGQTRYSTDENINQLVLSSELGGNNIAIQVEYNNIVTVDFQDGDLVMIEDLSGVYNLSTFNAGGGPSYDAIPTPWSDGTTYGNINKLNAFDAPQTETFLYWSGNVLEGFLTIPEITIINPSGLDYLIIGRSFNSAAIRIYAIGGFGEQLIGQGIHSDFVVGGILVTIPLGTEQLRADAVGPSGCVLGQSNTYNLSLFTFDITAITFDQTDRTFDEL